MSKVLLCTTASVASVLTSKMATELRNQGHEVKVVSSFRALYFFKTDLLSWRHLKCFLTHKPYRTHLRDKKGKDTGIELWTDLDEWPIGGWHKGDPVRHIELGDWADIILITPITAHTIAEIAHGFASKLLTSLILAWGKRKPVLIAPAMNTGMWENELVQGNLSIIEEVYHAIVINPIEGDLACGVRGVGALANISDIISAVDKLARGE